jgi:hypothetical protein
MVHLTIDDQMDDTPIDDQLVMEGPPPDDQLVMEGPPPHTTLYIPEFLEEYNDHATRRPDSGTAKELSERNWLTPGLSEEIQNCLDPQSLSVGRGS